MRLRTYALGGAVLAGHARSRGPTGSPRNTPLCQRVWGRWRPGRTDRRHDPRARIWRRLHRTSSGLERVGGLSVPRLQLGRLRRLPTCLARPARGAGRQGRRADRHDSRRQRWGRHRGARRLVPGSRPRTGLPRMGHRPRPRSRESAHAPPVSSPVDGDLPDPHRTGPTRRHRARPIHAVRVHWRGRAQSCPAGGRCPDPGTCSSKRPISSTTPITTTPPGIGPSPPAHRSSRSAPAPLPPSLQTPTTATAKRAVSRAVSASPSATATASPGPTAMAARSTSVSAIGSSPVSRSSPAATAATAPDPISTSPSASPVAPAAPRR